MIAEIITDRGLESLNRFYATYRAVVVANEDPNNQQRLKVVCPSVENEMAVWAYPKGQHGDLNSGFKYLPPRVGSIVWVEFVNGDPLYPVWSYLSWAVGEIPDDLKGNHMMGFVTPSGNTVTLDESSGELMIKVEGNVTVNANNINLNGNDQGITLTDKLVEKINNLETQLNNLKNQITMASNAVVPQDGGKAAFTSLSTWANPKITLTTQDELENKTVKQ